MKNNKNTLKNSAKLLLSSLVFIFLVQCSTSNYGDVDYTFKPSVNASWDGNEQNSGILSYDKENGFVITEGAEKRYSDLTEKYGKTYIPKLSRGEGIVKKDGKIYLPNQYMVIFGVLNQKNKRGDLE